MTPTTSVISILIAAVMISGSAVSAIGLSGTSGTSNNINVEENSMPTPNVEPTLTALESAIPDGSTSPDEVAPGLQQGQTLFTSMPANFDDELWNNSLDYSNAGTSQNDTYINLQSWCADDFEVQLTSYITEVTWIGGWSNYDGGFDMNLIFYEDDGTGAAPGTEIAMYMLDNSDCDETSLGSGYYSYHATLPEELQIMGEEKYWMCAQAQADYPPQWGFAMHTSLIGAEGAFKSPYFGYDDWVPNSQVFGTAYDHCFVLYGYMQAFDYDVGVVEITSPQDGNAAPDLPMNATIKNYGNYTAEDVEVQYEIIKCEAGPLILDENFSGTFPPAGWSTDYFDQVYSNNAGGTSPPEAALEYYDYFYDSAYLQTAPVNCTGYEKVNVKFRMMTDTRLEYYSPFFYLKYRKNSTASWTDLTPWENPLPDMDPDWWEIGCYGWGGNIGTEFQVKWAFVGNYYYLEPGSGIYIDDVSIEGCTGCAEYAELNDEIDPLEPDEEVVVEFPTWTPSEWQNESFQDTWEEYPVSVYTIYDLDENPLNDEERKLLNLYYPYLHDVGAFDVSGPESGPAQTFPMKAKIKNYGQNEECCFKTYVQVSELDLENPDQLFEEHFPSCSPWPPTGWTNTDPDNWRCSYTSYAGGYSPEARFYYYPVATKTFRLYTPAIDTTGYGAVEIEFKHYVNHYTTPYTLKVEVSEDAVSWKTIWEIQPSGSIGPETITLTTGDSVGGDLYVSWTFEGYSWNINYWFVDDIVINGFPAADPEYEEYMCTTSIEVGEEQEFDYPDWTPDFLSEGENGNKIYLIKAFTDMIDPEDGNQANDAYQTSVELDFFHDVGITEITSPSEGRDPGDVLWDMDVESITGDSRCLGVEVTDDDYIWVTGANDMVNCKLYKIDWDGNLVDTYDQPSHSSGWGWRDLTYDGEYLYASVNDNIDQIDPATGEWTGETIPGPIYPCRALAYDPKTDHFWTASFSSSFYEIDRDGTIINVFGNPWGAAYGFAWDDLPGQCDGPWLWVHDQYGSGTDIHQVDPETGTHTGLTYSYGTGIAGGAAMIDKDGLGQFVGLTQSSPDTVFGMEICETIWQPKPEIYVPIGSQDVEAIAENLGTFPELDMTCLAEIFEFITNCTNGTEVYNDTITDIDIEEPLGGTETLNFEDYYFGIEGVYGLRFNLTMEDEDIDLDNNLIRLGIGCDDTPPETTHTLDPATPDGNNSWYVSDVTVTVDANDPSIGCGAAGSGVAEIKYTIDGASGSITGDHGTFKIEDDGKDIEVEYWAVDNVGNTEAKHSFTIDMDQTTPVVPDKISWEAFKQGSLWYVEFKVNCTDAMSDMDKVIWYLNDVKQIVKQHGGPAYNWTIEWSKSFHGNMLKMEAFDLAGNSDFVELDLDDVTAALPHPQQQGQSTSPNIK